MQDVRAWRFCAADRRHAKLVYATVGRLNEAKDNVVLFPTWGSGTPDEVVGLMTGVGRALDPNRYFIVGRRLFDGGDPPLSLGGALPGRSAREAISQIDSYVGKASLGDSQIPLLSSARVASFPLEEFGERLGAAREEEALERIAHETRTAGRNIIDAKGATYYGIGAALVRIIRAILRDEDAILTVSSLVPEWMQLGEVSLSLPSIVNRHGISRVLPVALNSSEREALEASAGVIRTDIAILSEAIPT